jgi:hypothetical protein
MFVARSRVPTLEEMIGNHTVVSWMKSRFMLFLFSGVEQWIWCMILFCDMLYVLQCTTFYISVNFYLSINCSSSRFIVVVCNIFCNICSSILCNISTLLHINMWNIFRINLCSILFICVYFCSM